MGREFKFIGSHLKSDFRTISGVIFVFVHMFACTDENVKFFNLQINCMSHTNRKTMRRCEEQDIPGF